MFVHNQLISSKPITLNTEMLYMYKRSSLTPVVRQFITEQRNPNRVAVPPAEEFYFKCMVPISIQSKHNSRCCFFQFGWL